jgi:hypothetical protein
MTDDPSWLSLIIAAVYIIGVGGIAAYWLRRY